MDTFNIFTSIGTYIIAEGLLNICCCEVLDGMQQNY